MCNKRLLRLKFHKRLFLLSLSLLMIYYGSALLFGNHNLAPSVMHITELDKCPACYGVTVCPELYSNQIIIENSTRWSRLFNTKNIYYGYTKSNRKIVLKKLAHNLEFNKFDANLCTNWNLNDNCKPSYLINKPQEFIQKKILELVHYNISQPSEVVKNGLVMCPYASGIQSLIQPLLSNNVKDWKSLHTNLINIWTMLSLNPEPIILQTLSKSKGWPVPVFGGVCGRTEIVSYDGETLASLLHIKWHQKLLYAYKIIDAALDFTYKHERYRFYLMDWSLDNVVVNEKGDITFVDLEDIIVLDKLTNPKDLHEWNVEYKRGNIGSEFVFSVHEICRHQLSDHNLWAACHLLVSNHSNIPYLYPIPNEIKLKHPRLDQLLTNCLYDDADRLKTLKEVKTIIVEILKDMRVNDIGSFG